MRRKSHTNYSILQLQLFNVIFIAMQHTRQGKAPPGGSWNAMRVCHHLVARGRSGDHLAFLPGFPNERESFLRWPKVELNKLPFERQGS
ncbi:hypothetical protein ZHAS_00008574 [Anopheles sinensis]|uniref:Uncharacterized protein n=1 Tax=Anopheles sinensis TaxID=74873 RepID=A0A084VT21_ANOSI|nr:hypothetical protein ZHAS_00008574 [Anopheles sinensis]